MSDESPAEKLKESISSLEKAIVEYIGQVQQTKAALNKQIDDLNKQLGNVNKDKAKVDEQIEQLILEREDLNEMLNKQSEEMKKSATTIKEQLEKITNLSKELQFSEEEKKNLDKQLSELQNSAKILDERLKEYEQNVDKTVELTTEISELETKIANIEKQIAGLIPPTNGNVDQNQLLSLIAINQILKAELDAKQNAEKTTTQNLDNSNKELIIPAKDLEQNSNTLVQGINDVVSNQSKKEADELKAKSEIINSMATNLVNTILPTATATASKINDLNTQINNLQEQQKSCEQQKAELEKKISESTAKINELETKITNENTDSKLVGIESKDVYVDTANGVTNENKLKDYIKYLEESENNYTDNNSQNNLNTILNNWMRIFYEYATNDSINLDDIINMITTKSYYNNSKDQIIGLVNDIIVSHNRKLSKKTKEKDSEKDKNKKNELENELNKLNNEITRLQTLIETLTNFNPTTSGGKLPPQTIKKSKKTIKKHTNKHHTKKRFLTPLKHRRKRNTHKRA